jgi:hypothetical protein
MQRSFPHATERALHVARLHRLTVDTDTAPAFAGAAAEYLLQPDVRRLPRNVRDYLWGVADTLRAVSFRREG